MGSARTDFPYAVGAATATTCALGLFGGFAYGIGSWLIEGGSTEGLLSLSLYIGVVAATGAVFLCPLLCLVLGLPLYALSLRKRWVSARAWAAVGFGTSALVALALWHSDFSPWYDLDFGVPYTIAGGTAATLVLWRILRPDRALRG